MPIVLETSNIYVVAIAISGPTLVNDFGSVQYTAVATFSNSDSSPVTVDWSLFSNNVGAVLNSNGLLTVPNTVAGTVGIQARFVSGGLTLIQTLTVSINDVFAVQSLTISGLNAVVADSSTSILLSATATYSDASETAVTPIWSIVGPDYGASINSSGQLDIPKQSSEALITINASYTEAGVTVSQQFAITLSVTTFVGTRITMSTSLLILGDFEMAANNDTFLNGSSGSAPITKTGNVGQGTFSPYYPYWSTHFISSQAINCTASQLANDLILAGNKMTIECWIRITNNVAANAWWTNIFGNFQAIASNGRWNVFLIASSTTSNNQLAFHYTTDSSNYSTVQTPSFCVPLGRWVHLAVTIDASTAASSVLKMYVDGVQQLSTTINLSSHTVAYAGHYLGGQNYSSNSIQGYVCCFRIVKSLVYSSNFSVPTKPLEYVPGTVLLTCNSPRLEDRSGNSGSTSMVTPYGQPIASPVSPFVDAQIPHSPCYSAYFNGAIGNYLSTPNSSFLGLGNASFVFELWMCPHMGSSTGRICSIGEPTHGTGYPCITFYVTGGYIYAAASTSGTSWNAVAATALLAFDYGTWYHLAVQRTANTMRWFVNGQNLLTTAFSGTFLSSNKICLGWDGASGDATRFAGYITNARFVHEGALYGDTFVPDTSGPLTAIPSTEALLCVNSDLTDSGPNGLNMTLNGYVSFSLKSPFVDTWQNAVSTYDSQVHGGSMYFDGSSGNYLKCAGVSGLATSSATIEFWICPLSAGRLMRIFSMTQPTGGPYAYSYLSIFIDTNDYLCVAMSSNGTSWNYLPLTQFGTTSPAVWPKFGHWTHVAIVRDMTSSKVRGYFDGVCMFSTSVAGTNLGTSADIYVGWDGVSGDPYRYVGYVSGLRYTKSAVYVTGFQPSLLPPTDIANTVLILNSTNGGLANYSLLSDLMTINGATGSPLARQGSGSLYFDGTDDHIKTCGRPEYNQLSGVPFTIEFWLYPTRYAAGTVYNEGMTIVGANSTATNNGWRIDAGTALIGFNANNSFAISCPYEIKVWTHFAFVYDGSKMTLYKNGFAVAGPTTVSWTNNNDPLIIGAFKAPSYNYYFAGYVDSLRFSYGEVLYVADFEPIQFTRINKSIPTSRPGTVLLLDAEGASGSNTTFSDSTGVHTITNVGSSGCGSFSPFGSNWSSYFSASVDMLEIPASIDFVLSTGQGDFTLECWINLNAYPTANGNFVFGTADPWFGNGGWALVVLQAGFYFSGGGATIITSPQTWRIGKWTHLAVTRTNTTYALFVDGAMIAQATNPTRTPDDVSNPLRIGCHPSYTGLGLNGQVSNIRIVKGTSLYTQAFTVPVSKLAPVTGTKLLTCQDNHWTDNSGSNRQFTVVGTPAVKRVNPFEANTFATSLDFGGTANVTAPANSAFALGAGDFTVELWVNASGVAYSASYYYTLLLGTRATSAADVGTWALAIDTINKKLWFSEIVNVPAAIIDSGNNSISLNVWTHVAVCRKNGTCSIFVNGQKKDSKTLTTNFNNSSYQLFFGMDPNSSVLQGQMSNIRIIKGQAVYDPAQATLTVPTTHFENVAGTTLLTLQRSGLYDESSTATSFTTSPSPVPSFKSPFANVSGAAYFSGGSSLTVPNNADFSFGSSDFTVEGWVYPTANTVNAVYVWIAKFSGVRGEFYISQKNGQMLFFLASVSNSWDIANGLVIGNLQINAWNHFALCRSGSSFKSFLNGVAGATATSSSSLLANTSVVRVGDDGTGGYAYGYASNIRLVKGDALYSADFVPPTSSLAVTANTKLLIKAEDAGIIDFVGNNTPILSGVTTTTAQRKYGTKSMFFNGSSWVKIITKNPINFDGDFTVEWWQYIATTQTSQPHIFRTDSSSVSVGYNSKFICTANGWVQVANTSLNGWSIEMSWAPPSINAWHHLAITRNGSKWRVWLDGVQVAIATYSGAVPSPSGDFQLGYGGTATSYFNGYIDNFKITVGESLYNVPFTPV